ncbi:MAG: glycoside hydrolase family 66 protein [Candidatus Sumerlaeia bacterium]|nr:glycoside hydrolase family 66 protein [Candidatus Sumerlaeia bacterium]
MRSRTCSFAAKALRRTAGAALAALAASAAPTAAHSLGTEPRIARVFLEKAFVAPGESGGVFVRLGDAGSLAPGDTLRLAVFPADGSPLHAESRAPAGEFTDFTIPAGLPEGGHRLEVALLRGGAELGKVERVHSVVADIADDVRYGFYTNFGAFGGDYTEKTNILVEAGLNAVEYYDWFPAHGDYTPEAQTYPQEPFGQVIELRDVQGKMEQARAKNIRNIAYIAAYAAVPRIANAIPGSKLTTSSGEPVVFYQGSVAPQSQLSGVWFNLTAFAPGTSWRPVLWDELTNALDLDDSVSFDGFELDTYGWNEPYHSAGSPFNGTPIMEMLADLTGDVRGLTRSIKPGGLTTLNTIAEVEIERFYEKVDFLFVENWAFHKPRYDAVARMVASNHSASGKRFVSKCYPADMEGGRTIWPVENLTLLLAAHLYGGGSFMVAGEPREATGQIGGFNSLYYPDNLPQPEENHRAIRNYNTHDALLYGLNHGPEVRLRATEPPLPGAMAMSYLGAGGAATWCLLRLDGADEWTRETAPASELAEVEATVTLPNGFAPRQVVYGTPDDDALVFHRAVDWSVADGRLTARLPKLRRFGSLIAFPFPVDERLRDAASLAEHAGGWAGAWRFGGVGGGAGVFIGDSRNNGGAERNDDCDINTERRAWALFSGASGLVDAQRDFPALEEGESLRLLMDNGFVLPGGAVGFGLHNAQGGRLLELFFRGGQASYIVFDAAGERLSGIPFTDEGLDIEVTIGAAGAYSMRVVPIGAESGTRTVSGSLMAPAGGQAAATLRLFSFAAGVGPAHDAYFNDLSIYRAAPAGAGVDSWLLF